MELQDRTAQLLQAIERELPQAPPWPGAGNHTVGFIRCYLGWRRRSAPELTAALASIARKVDVAKAVWESYDDKWRRPLERTPLSPSGWAALAGIFALDAGRAQRPRRLKQLNTALNALEGYRQAGGGTHLEVLEAIIEESLERALEC